LPVYGKPEEGIFVKGEKNTLGIFPVGIRNAGEVFIDAPD
jgi:hypothetical protein